MLVFLGAGPSNAVPDERARMPEVFVPADVDVRGFPCEARAQYRCDDV